MEGGGGVMYVCRGGVTVSERLRRRLLGILFRLQACFFLMLICRQSDMLIPASGLTIVPSWAAVKSCAVARTAVHVCES
jgi:hypothetical protein